MNNRKNTNTSYMTYTDLYHEIKTRLTERNSLYSFLTFIFAPNYFLLNLAFVFALTYLTIQDPIGALGFGFYVLFLTIFAILLVEAFISLALIGSRNSEKYVKKIISWLVISARTPFQNKFGLNLQELAVIKSIAQSEQAAADWRSTYVNIMVIGSIGFLWGGGTAAAEWFSQTLPDNFEVQLLFSMRPTYVVILITLGWGLMCFVANLFGAKLLSYLHDFLISEFSNRAIIYACLEAEALFLSRNIEQNDVLSMDHKRYIANTIGYFVVSTQDKEWNYLSRSINYFFHRGQEYALVEEVERNKILKRIANKQKTPLVKLIASKISSLFGVHKKNKAESSQKKNS